MASARRVRLASSSVLHGSFNLAGGQTQATLSPKRESPPSRGGLVVPHVDALVVLNVIEDEELGVTLAAALR
jgi:hypothetical protein